MNFLFDSLKEQIEDQLGVNCEICYEQFDTQDRIPLMFSCRHSFCQNCIITWVQTAQYVNKLYVNCSICKKKQVINQLLPIPEKFFKNFKLLELLTTIYENQSPKECNHDDPTFTCFNPTCRTTIKCCFPCLSRLHSDCDT